MRKSKSIHGSSTNQNYHPNKPFFKAPVIIGEVLEGGEMFYVSVDNVLYRKILHDRFFKFTKGIVKHNSFKGDNPNKGLI